MFQFVMVLLLIGAGLLSLCKPEAVWMLYESWKSSGDAEPSDSYLVITRISGVAAIILGVVLLVTLGG